MAWTRTRLEVPAITGDPSVLLAAPPPDGGWTPRLGRTVTGGQVSRVSILSLGVRCRRAEWQAAHAANRRSLLVRTLQACRRSGSSVHGKGFRNTSQQQGCIAFDLFCQEQPPTIRGSSIASLGAAYRRAAELTISGRGQSGEYYYRIPRGPVFDMLCSLGG